MSPTSSITGERGCRWGWGREGDTSDGAFLCMQVAGLSPVLHAGAHRLPPGLPGAGQALPMPPHHVSMAVPGSAVPGAASLRISPLSPQDAVLWAADPHPQLGLCGCGHGGGSGEWGQGRARGRGHQSPSCPAPVMSLLSPQGTSDFCVAPDKFIMNQTESDISAGESWLWGGDVLGGDTSDTPKPAWGPGVLRCWDARTNVSHLLCRGGSLLPVL